MIPFQIGITGGIGAGKSIVTQIFSLFGIPVYDADSNAKLIMQNDKLLIDEISKIFGKNAYFPDGSLNNKYLSQKVFSDQKNIKSLNAIVHPAVKRHYQKWVENNRHAPYVLKEAAILFESKSNVGLDKVIVVSAPDSLRVERTLIRDRHRSREEVLAIMERQMPEEKKIPLADYVICNDDSQLIIPQVIEIDSQLKNR